LSHAPLKVGRSGFDYLAVSGQKNFKSWYSQNGRRQRGAERGRDPIWIFIDSTDKVEGGLMLFLGVVFPVAPWKFFCRRPWFTAFLLDVQHKNG